MTKNILGISAFYHDSAAALIRDGEIIAAVQEERFSRKKGEAKFPLASIRYCLVAGEISIQDVDHIVFYDNPYVKFSRLIETYLAFAPKGLDTFLEAMHVWKDKFFLKKLLRNELARLANCCSHEIPPISFGKHHLSHAAAAFYPSPFEKAAVLCLDGVGEWTSTSVWHGEGNQLDLKWTIDFPHSLGLLYAAFTYYTGFKVNSGEYKVMGLAPYGEPKYYDLIMKELIDLKEDGTFRINMRYFDFATGFTMTNELFHKLFGGPPREPESYLKQRDLDIARSIQEVTEEIILRLGRTISKELGAEYLCLAGGVALNCVANGRLLREGVFKDLWIQPAAGDAGGALGAALAYYHQDQQQPRHINHMDSMHGSFLGPAFSDKDIVQYLNSVGAVYEKIDDVQLFPLLAKVLEQGNIVGWFRGRMEYGPRALGARSILGDPRNPQMQSDMNLKIKFRESFRPFAPSVLDEMVGKYFELDRPSPYMLLVSPVNESIRIPMTEVQQGLFGIDKLNVARSNIPAVTHVDYSARVQTVHAGTNPGYYELLKCFEKRTGCGVLVNTSFNVRGEPIVCSPEDAYRCFMRTGIDCLVLENYLLYKDKQPKREQDSSWKNEFQLD